MSYFVQILFWSTGWSERSVKSILWGAGGVYAHLSFKSIFQQNHMTEEAPSILKIKFVITEHQKLVSEQKKIPTAREATKVRWVVDFLLSFSLKIG